MSPRGLRLSSDGRNERLRAYHAARRRGRVALEPAWRVRRLAVDEVDAVRRWRNGEAGVRIGTLPTLRDIQGPGATRI